MKRLFKTVAIILLCGALAVPSIDAQNRGRNNNTGSVQSTHRPTNRPGNDSNPKPNNNSGSSLPGGNSSSSRPTNNRPANRPDNNHNDRPEGPSNNGPTAGNRPQGQRPPSQRPNNPPAQHHHGPVRPNMPTARPFHRPTPPPRWTPPPTWVTFNSVLGITFGSAFTVTLNTLLSNGYTINSYGNNEIYVANVNMLGMTWPDAVLHCDSAGRLYASSFVYSTSGYSMNRYNTSYTSLVRTYGNPISVQSINNGVEATWWGTNNQFIRLSYMPEYANNGSLRYYTTLSYGNY